MRARKWAKNPNSCAQKRVEYLSYGFRPIIPSYIFNFEKGLTRASSIEATKTHTKKRTRNLGMFQSPVSHV